MTMYTPDDIRNIQFTKSMGGYKTAEVDPFIDKCADTVEALLREKAELTKKLEVLADKLVEYRNDEDNIRTALLSAQRLGDTVVREANHKAGLILEDANIKAEKITSVAKRNIQEEEAELERIKREVAAFKKKMLSMYRDHLTLIDALPELKEEPPASPEVPAEEPPAAPVPEAGSAAPVAAVEPVEEVPAVPAPPAVPVPPPAVEPMPSFAANIPQLPEDEIQVESVIPNTTSPRIPERPPASLNGKSNAGIRRPRRPVRAAVRPLSRHMSAWEGMFMQWPSKSNDPASWWIEHLPLSGRLGCRRSS